MICVPDDYDAARAAFAARAEGEDFCCAVCAAARDMLPPNSRVVVLMQPVAPDGSGPVLGCVLIPEPLPAGSPEGLPHVLELLEAAVSMLVQVLLDNWPGWRSCWQAVCAVARGWAKARRRAASKEVVQ